MLDEPRELLACALFPLYPLEPPPKALLFAPELCGMSRLPTLLAPPPPADRVLALGLAPAERLLVLGLAPAERLLALAVPPRLALLGVAPARLACCCAPCRLAVEPPYLLAVAWFAYGAPPRCCGLCCQLLLPPPP